MFQRGEREASPRRGGCLDRLKAVRRSDESYSDVVLRIAGGSGAAIGCIRRRVSRIFSANRRHPASRLCRLQVGQVSLYAEVTPRRDHTGGNNDHYIALFNLTEAGIKAAKDSPRRLDAAKKLLADMGGEMKQFYMVMGEFDFVGICEAPDDAVMARYVLLLGRLGFVRTKTLKAFPETAYREIIRSLG